MLPTRSTQHHAAALPRRWVLWLAVFLAVLGALAPPVSQALNWARGGGPARLTEICTSAGPRWMALGQAAAFATASSMAATPATLANTPPDNTPAQIFDHCPFCLLLADRAAPPPQHGAADFLPPGPCVSPAGAQTVFLPAFVAPTPPPRGPPDSA